MKPRLYGLMAEFRQPEALVRAARTARERGLAGVDAYAPFPVPDLAEAVGYPGSRAVPCATLIGGIAGGAGGYFMQWYAATQSYPVNVGGRPLHSWPLFIPVTFELTILCAAICAVVAMLGANGLPRLHHPVFATPGFDLASRDRFFLCVRLPEACTEDDPSYDRAMAVLRETDPIDIQEVPA
ncbi:Quinol:cytochrome c oxidoreductase membrane protein [Bordetella sputigena]|uniref:DUF3341 domain-containing protein n=1 Tax=Bordetella sputigena TaxID=1416810 RepID=UPI0039F06665